MGTILSSASCRLFPVSVVKFSRLKLALLFDQSESFERKRVPSFYAVFVSARMLLLGQFDLLLSNLRVSRLTRRPSTITSCLPPTARDGSSSDGKDGRRHEAFFRRRPCLDNKLPRTPGKATHPPAAGCSRQGVRRVARPPVAVSAQERRDYAYKRGAAARGSPPKAFQVRRSSAKEKKPPPFQRGNVSASRSVAANYQWRPKMRTSCSVVFQQKMEEKKR